MKASQLQAPLKQYKERNNAAKRQTLNVADGYTTMGNTCYRALHTEIIFYGKSGMIFNLYSIFNEISFS